MTQHGPTLASPQAGSATQATTVYLSLGANLEDRRATMRQAIKRLANTPEITLDLIRDVASLYESAPVGCASDQPDYLNTVVRLRTTLSAGELLALTQDIERDLGRTRREANEPRVIDIDILVYGTLEHDDGNLTLPHPRTLDRRFVLEPLAELAPRLCVPPTMMTVSEAAERAAKCLSSQQIRRVANAVWAAIDD